MTTCNWTRQNNHIILHLKENHNCLVDTGTPLTMSECPDISLPLLSVRSVAYSCMPGLDMNAVSRFVGIPLHSILGMGTLNTMDLELKTDGTAFFNPNPGDLLMQYQRIIPYSLQQGVPVTQLDLHDLGKKTFIFDTGAPMAYVTTAIKGTPAEPYEDYWPMAGSFRTNTVQTKIEDKIVRVGIQPPQDLVMMLSFLQCFGVIGPQLFDEGEELCISGSHKFIGFNKKK